MAYNTRSLEHNDGGSGEGLCTSIKYFDSHQVCKYINRRLELYGELAIIPATLSEYRKKGLLPLSDEKKKTSYTKEEIDNILGLVYLHNYLGISYARLRFTQKYLKELKGNNHIHRFINLYEGNSK